MVAFVVFAFLIAVSTNLYEFIIFRIILGFSIGADVTTGFSYIYEYISLRQRTKFYSLWAYSFAVVALIAVFTVFLLYHLVQNIIIWRYIFVIGGVFAAIILILRSKLRETPVWLYYNGDSKGAESIIREVYGDTLIIDKQDKQERSLKDIVRVYRSGLNKEIIFTYSLNCIVGFIGWGFAFYITYMLFELHFISFFQILEADSIIYFFGFLGAIISPFISRKFGIYKASVIPSIIAAISLFLLFTVFSNILPGYFIIPLSAIIIFFNYAGPMAYNAVLNSFIPSKIRGTANGQNYMVNKIVEAGSGFAGGFLLITIGLRYNTLVLAFIVFSLVLIASITGRSRYFTSNMKSDYK